MFSFLCCVSKRSDATSEEELDTILERFTLEEQLVSTSKLQSVSSLISGIDDRGSN